MGIIISKVQLVHTKKITKLKKLCIYLIAISKITKKILKVKPRKIKN